MMKFSDRISKFLAKPKLGHKIKVSRTDRNKRMAKRKTVYPVS